MRDGLARSKENWKEAKSNRHAEPLLPLGLRESSQGKGRLSPGPETQTLP